MSEYTKINTACQNWCLVSFEKDVFFPIITRDLSTKDMKDTYRKERDYYNDKFKYTEGQLSYQAGTGISCVMCVEDSESGLLNLHFLGGITALNLEPDSFHFIPRGKDNQIVGREEINYPLKRSIEDINNFGHSVYLGPEIQDLPSITR